ncbi:MAG: thymidine phosphorylase family protein [Acidimicrobiales bacterium]|nr:thymidine phosphorylase family protein [Hyphomonadaceae bacterium]RZV43266.1 MAG: thymidine phosphorylase family protein [Acidimicrobiales bacterium]
MSLLNAPNSLRFIREKIEGTRFTSRAFTEIVYDIQAGVYSSVHTAAFLTACAAMPLDADEVYNLTRAMVKVGHSLKWQNSPVVDKHCVGGLPGNRTTPIIVSIVAAAGLTIPKTSSRAITSAAGTADTMEVFAPVDLNIDRMKYVVDQEGGCVVWGGNVGLSPVDDELVRVARALDFDGHGQMVASVLSKKIAAGASHVVIDVPIGPSAKIRNEDEAKTLRTNLMEAAKSFGLTLTIKQTDGTQPIGWGIGPALEARDVHTILTSRDSGPGDLREKALMLTGSLLEIGGKARVGEGHAKAREILQSGKAWEKFQAICEAQGGMRDIPTPKYTHPVLADSVGDLMEIDNKHIARIAKTAGAPEDKCAGLDLHVRLGQKVYVDQPVFTLHTANKAARDRALSLVELEGAGMQIVGEAEKLRRYV